MLRPLTALVLAGSLAFAPVANACTGIRLSAKDGTEVAGRTLEFGTPVDWYVAVVPAGTEISPEVPQGSGGLTYKTKYRHHGHDRVLKRPTLSTRSTRRASMSGCSTSPAMPATPT